MSIVETSLIFVGIPAAVFIIVAALVYGGSASRTQRYRPGGPWQFEPVWYLPHLPHPSPVLSAHADGHDSSRQALPGRVVVEPALASGGASGEW